MSLLAICFHLTRTGPLPCSWSVYLFSRVHTLEKMLLLVGHLIEKLVLCPHRLSQAEPLGTKVGLVVRGSGLHYNYGSVQG